MSNQDKAKAQLIDEWVAMHHRIAELGESEAGREQVEEALQKERNFISTILDTAGALVVVLDMQGRIVRFNRACEQTTGYSFDEVKGRYLWDVLLIPEEVAADHPDR